MIAAAAQPITSSIGQPGPLGRRLRDRIERERVPVTGGIELTHRCNLACVHCYVNLPGADRAAARREMTTAQVLRLIDELADLGTLKLTLTGGEPLIRGDFPAIYRHAHRKGILVAVYTNATLVTPKIATLFADCPPARVEVTQYGHAPATYDRVAGAGTGQHGRFARGVELLLAAGVRVRLKTVALRSNRHEVSAMKTAAEARGLPFRFDAVISPRIDGGRGPLAERLSPAELAAVEAEASEPAAFAEHCAELLGQEPPGDALYACGAGRWTFLVDPYGRLHVCELSRRPGWDVVGGGFARGWHEAIPALLGERRPDGAACGSCADHALCSNCTGMAELEGRAAGDADPYLCDVAGARGRQALVAIRLPREAGRAAR